MARKSLILQLSLATIIGMPMVAVIIDRFSETVDLRASLLGNGQFLHQAMVGIVIGVIAALLARAIISSPLLRNMNTRYANLLGRFQLNTSEVLFVSLCAGVGEEILFRGAIQPLLGIAFTSVLFVAIHGYLSPANWRLSIYGLYMTVVIATLGYFTVSHGLLTAILAHTIIDIVLIFHLQKTAGEVDITENHDLKDDEPSTDNDSF